MIVSRRHPLRRLQEVHRFLNATESSNKPDVTPYVLRRYLVNLIALRRALFCD